MKKLILMLVVAIAMSTAACAGESKRPETSTPAQKTEVAPKAQKTEAMEPMPTVVDFSATWCGPCKKFAPIFHSMEKEYAGKIRFLTIDVDQHPELAQQYGIQAVPTIICLSADGRILKRMEGAPDESYFRSMLEGMLQTERAE